MGLHDRVLSLQFLSWFYYFLWSLSACWINENIFPVFKAIRSVLRLLAWILEVRENNVNIPLDKECNISTQSDPWYQEAYKQIVQAKHYHLSLGYTGTKPCPVKAILAYIVHGYIEGTTQGHFSYLLISRQKLLMISKWLLLFQVALNWGYYDA